MPDAYVYSHWYILNLMRIVFFAHPEFLNLKSMIRYTAWVTEEMKAKGHSVDIWSAKPYLYNIPCPKKIKKWLAYIDQLLIFPIQAKARIKKTEPDTLFVFLDHALGPWVPLIHQRPHVIHCHDFIAQKNALGSVDKNSIGFTGRAYQALIRKGFSMGKNFITVSSKTQDDLKEILTGKAIFSKVIYNGLLQETLSYDSSKTRSDLSISTEIDLSRGYLLHVGGNQWYKNRIGVIQLYEAWRKKYQHKQPLLLIGEGPCNEILDIQKKSTFSSDIHFLTGKDDLFVRKAYAGATLLLFPSYAEGFGWPIIEAMASGCPVVIPDDAPMNEIGGNAAVYLEKTPAKNNRINWLNESSGIIENVVTMNVNDRQKVIRNGFENVMRFHAGESLDSIEKFYSDVLSAYN